MEATRVVCYLLEGKSGVEGDVEGHVEILAVAG